MIKKILWPKILPTVSPRNKATKTGTSLIWKCSRDSTLCTRFEYNGLVSWKSIFGYNKFGSYHWFCRCIPLSFSNFELWRHSEFAVLSFFMLFILWKKFSFVTWYTKTRADLTHKNTSWRKKGKRKDEISLKTERKLILDLSGAKLNSRSVQTKKGHRRECKNKMKKNFYGDILEFGPKSICYFHTRQ